MGVEFESDIPEDEVPAYDDAYAQRAREIRLMLLEIPNIKDRGSKELARETVAALLARIRPRTKPEQATVSKLRADKPI